LAYNKRVDRLNAIRLLQALVAAGANAKAPMTDAWSLIVELKTLHKKLQTDGNRIQRDIAEHAELSQQVMQLTKIIFDSAKKLRGRAA
jgi:hypothetical protein